MNQINKILSFLLGLCVIALIVVTVMLNSKSTALGGKVHNQQETFDAGIAVNGTEVINSSGAFVGSVSGTSLTGTSLTVTGTSTSKNVVAVNGTASSTMAIGSSAIGTNVGKLCLWNGTNYTIMTYPANSTTTATVATSTTCLAN
jgi:hypothetical protein